MSAQPEPPKDYNILTNTKQVTLDEMLSDNSPYMEELVEKFLDMYGDELEQITGMKFTQDDNEEQNGSN